MFSEISEIDLITVLLNGVMQIRRCDRVLKDDVEIAKTYHRHSLNPGDSLDGQDARVTAIAKIIWTQETIDAYKKSIEAATLATEG